MNDDRFSVWLERFGDVLTRAGGADAASLFSLTSEYHEAPFEPPIIGRAAIALHLQELAAEREETEFHFEVIHFDSGTGWASWNSGFTRKGLSSPVRQEGILKALFDRDGFCHEFRQWWNGLEPGQLSQMRDFDA